ncbi:MAG TPA: TetR/AcrR family transcriptional regulator [Polyangiaceae bacterium]|nr:TetR/AcrR family transcriptional regulator [Polyangiaceae bacterium]
MTPRSDRKSAPRTSPGKDVGESSPRSSPAKDGSKRLSPDERRAQLMAVAEKLFQTKPYDDIGIADVARAAGVAHGLIYHYFSSKEELFLATFASLAEELLSRCTIGTAVPASSFREQSLRGIRGYLDFCEQHAVAYVNLFRGPIAGHTEFLRICEATRAELVNRLLLSLSLDPASVPATRLSMRGHVGYAEAVVLEWLDRRTVSRARVEELLATTVEAAVAAGLALDGRAELASGIHPTRR